MPEAQTVIVRVDRELSVQLHNDDGSPIEGDSNILHDSEKVAANPGHPTAWIGGCELGIPVGVWVFANANICFRASQELQPSVHQLSVWLFFSGPADPTPPDARYSLG